MNKLARLAASLLGAIFLLGTTLISLEVLTNRMLAKAAEATYSGLTTNEWLQIQNQISGQLQELKLTASDPRAYDLFGNGVDIDGNTLVIGAPEEDGGPGDPLPNAGAAYVFLRIQGIWTQVAKLTAADAQVLDAFGTAVAIDGDTIVVGAYGEDGGPGDPLPFAGAAYIFNRNQGGTEAWGQVAKLTANDQETWDFFGLSVAISGNTVIVGAENEDGNPADPIEDQGAVYIFNRNQGGTEAWGQVAKLTAGDPDEYNRFGSSIAIDGDTVVVGSPFEWLAPPDPTNYNTGAAYVYERNQGGPEVWGQVAKLLSDDPQPGDQLGTSVSIDNDTIVVGAIMAPDEFPSWGPGKAYVYERNEGGPNNWGQKVKLSANDGEDQDYFGYSVAIHNNTIVVGAKYNDGSGNPQSHAGAAYIFNRDHSGSGSWGQVSKLTASDPVQYDLFGETLAIFNDTVLVGAPNKDSSLGGPTPNTGAAYLFLNPAVLNVVKDGPHLTTQGETITYTLTVTNGHPITLSNLVLTDTIPTGATYISGGTLVGNVVSWTVSSLSPGQTISRQFSVTTTTNITNSDFKVSADEGYQGIGLIPVSTNFVTDYSYLPIILKP